MIYFGSDNSRRRRRRRLQNTDGIRDGIGRRDGDEDDGHYRRRRRRVPHSNRMIPDRDRPTLSGDRSSIYGYIGFGPYSQIFSLRGKPPRRGGDPTQAISHQRAAHPWTRPHRHGNKSIRPRN